MTNDIIMLNFDISENCLWILYFKYYMLWMEELAVSNSSFWLSYQIAAFKKLAYADRHMQSTIFVRVGFNKDKLTMKILGGVVSIWHDPF